MAEVCTPSSAVQFLVSSFLDAETVLAFVSRRREATRRRRRRRGISS